MRYSITIQKYIWADSDEEAIEQIKELIKELIKESENDCKVISLVESEFGKVNQEKLNYKLKHKMEKSNQLVVDPKEFGIEETKAVQIAAQFKPMLDRMVELEKEFNEVAKLPIEDKATAAKAKELRLKYVKVRTGTAAIHKEQKDFYLKAGRFIDGWKNAQLFASEGNESKLSEIENHFENLEKQRIADLQNERVELLKPFGVDGSQLPLGTMESDVWDNYLSGTKLGYEQRIAAEKQAEIDRLEAVRIENERIEAQRIENERLKKEAEKREAEIEAERKETARLQQIENDRIEAERKESARLQAIETARIEAERKAERAEAKRLQDIKDKEFAESEAKRLEAEKLLKEKEAKELQDKLDLEAKAEAELSKGDAEKFQSLINDIESLKTKYSFKSAKYKKLQATVNELLDKIVNHVK